MKNKADIPHRYVYLDVEGIESLYVQIVELNICETILKQGTANKGKISGKLGLGKFLSTFLNFADIDVSPELERSSNAETSTKSTLPPEHKLRDLLHHLSQVGEPSVFTDLDRAANYCRDSNEMVFLRISETFDAPQFYGGQGHVDVNESKTVMFEKNICKNKDTYVHNDNYYKRTKCTEIPIFMSSSLLKYPSYKNGTMGATSHEAVMFRAFDGFDIPLSLFGAFFYLQSFFQIKPYAIWR